MQTAIDDVFPLARRRIRRRARRTALLGALLMVGPVGLMLYVGLPLDDLMGSPLGLGLLAGLYLLVRGIGRMRALSQAAIVLGQQALVLPPAITAGGAVRVAYADIELLLLQRANDGGRLLVGTRARLHSIPAVDLGGLMTLMLLYDGLRRRIVSLPDGLTRWARLEGDLKQLRTLLDRRARVTRGLMTLVIGYFLLQVVRGAAGLSGEAEGVGALLKLGANAAPLIADGQYFRWVSATFLHGGLLHIGINAMALLAVGGLVERLLGGHRMLIIYTATGLVASIASTQLSDAWLSVGASGAIFGLLGALATLQLRRGRELPLGLAQSRRWWVFILGLNIALPLLMPQIDYWAHAGGFFAGMLIAWPLSGPRVALGGTAPPSWAVQALAMALAGTYAAGLALALAHARSDADDRAPVMEALVADAEADPELLNLFAWAVAIDPKAEGRALEAARAAAARIAAEQPERADYRDTHATALYRLGRAREAAFEEWSALARRDARVLGAHDATQLGRFVRAAGEAPLLRNADATPPVWRGRIDADGTLRLEADHWSGPVGLFGRIGRGDETTRWFRALIWAPPTEGEALVPGLDADAASLPADATIEVLLVTPLAHVTAAIEQAAWTSLTPTFSEGALWQGWPVEPRVAAYP